MANLETSLIGISFLLDQLQCRKHQPLWLLPHDQMEDNRNANQQGAKQDAGINERWHGNERPARKQKCWSWRSVVLKRWDELETCSTLDQVLG